MSDVLLIAVVFVVGAIVGDCLARADMAAWAEQAARRDLARLGLTVHRRDPLTPADYAWLQAHGIDSETSR